MRCPPPESKARHKETVRRGDMVACMPLGFHREGLSGEKQSEEEGDYPRILLGKPLLISTKKFVRIRDTAR